ncbi:MAG: cyclic-di-AMP receptor [Oscillospiraceae bacterium]|nr:cyclic-di-AMP receptor [Oscillospiraceae bacterium]
MKMVMAIINADDANTVISNLTKEGFSVTKLATTGGFLKTGNTTVLIGVEDEKLNAVLEIINKHSHSRKQLVPATAEFSVGMIPSVPVEISVGGATIFVMNVEHFEKI